MRTPEYTMDKPKTKTDTVAIELPAYLIENLKKECKLRRKTVEQIIAEVLEDRADFLLAEQSMKDIKSGKTKLIPMEKVAKKLKIDLPTRKG